MRLSQANKQNILKSEYSNKIRGFTLIELLVVIVTVGVLSSIALPSFINQVGKARGAEAKSGLGAINRSQQAYRFETGFFSDNLTNLDVRVPSKHYSYGVSSHTQNTAGHQTSALEEDLKNYSSWVRQTGDQFFQFICESNTTSIGVSSAMISDSCPGNYKSID